MIEKRVNLNGLKLLFNEEYLVKLILLESQPILGTHPDAKTSDLLYFLEETIYLTHDEYCLSAGSKNTLSKELMSAYVMNSKMTELNSVLDAYQKFIYRNIDIIEQTLAEHFSKLALTRDIKGLALVMRQIASLWNLSDQNDK